jgi:hypothetical protein
LAYAFSPRILRARSCRAFAVLTLALCSSAQAADGLLLPPPPTGPGGEDSITTSEGVRCSQSINSNGGYLDLGVAGGDLNTYYDPDQSPGQSAVGYARVIIPLGKAPARLDCNRLYELEIQRLKAEIQLMQLGVQ